MNSNGTGSQTVPAFNYYNVIVSGDRVAELLHWLMAVQLELLAIAQYRLPMQTSSLPTIQLILMEVVTKY
ncbi:MAG: hypothetical protein IPF54_23910 [Draconibacterium sp.]|nr:hypothetical protein [Draconibacterium sp.]